MRWPEDRSTAHFPRFGPLVFFDLVLTFTLLLPHWFLLMATFIILVEAIFFHFFLFKNWRHAFLISGLVNFASALVGFFIMFLFPTGALRGEGAFFLSLVNGIQLFLEEGESYLFFVFFLLFIACVVTILIETLLSIKFAPSLSDKDRLLVFSLANLVSYASLVFFFTAIGLWFTFSYPNQIFDAREFFEGKLFHTVPPEGNSALLPQFLFLCCLFVLFFFFYYRTKPFRPTRPSEE